MKKAKKLLAIMMAAMMISSTIDYSGMMIVNAEETEAVTETVAESEAVTDTEAVEEKEVVTDTEAVAEKEVVTDSEAVVENETVTNTEVEEVSEPDVVAGTENITETKSETLNLSTEILVGLPDNDTLYEAYAQSQLYENGIDTYGTAAGSYLSYTEYDLYVYLKSKIKNIAKSGGDTYFQLDNYAYYYRWTGYSADEAAQNMLKGVENVVNALLLDCPYEMYWYDKDAGYEIRGNQGSYYEVYLTSISFPVADEYRSDMSNKFAVSSTKAAAITATETKAQEIVDKYKGQTPYNRMKGYAEEIYKLVSSYDKNAGDTYGDIAQVLNVFDGNPNTNVDSNGYARAFQYLCDLDGDLTCYTATGNIEWQNAAGDKTGNGAHVWNVVTLDGGNYIVDVTGSDKLFMVGGTGSSDKGYSVKITDDSDTYTILYTYDETTANAYSWSKRKIAADKYEPIPPSIISQPQAVTVKAGEKTTFTVNATGIGIKYQWQIDRNDSKGFVDISGANSASYTTGVVKEDCNNFKYKCVITNSNGYAETDAVTLTVAKSVTDGAVGSGTANDPYIVNTSDEFRDYLPIGFVKLDSDIVVSGDYISLTMENDSDLQTGLDLNGHILDFSGLGDSEEKNCTRGISADGTGKHKLSFYVSDSNPNSAHGVLYARDDGTPITGGVITGYECYAGGYSTESSIYINNAEFVMTGGTFFENKTDGGGSCIGIRGKSQVSISNTDFYNNEGGYFGTCVWYNNYSALGTDKTLKITNCNFMNNYGRLTSAIYSRADITLIDNCLIQDNVSEENGTVQIDFGTATINDTVIKGNESLEERFYTTDSDIYTAGVFVHENYNTVKIILDGKVIIRDNIICEEERNMDFPNPVELGSNFSSESDIGVLYSSRIGDKVDTAVVNNIGSFSKCFTSDVGDAVLYVNGTNLNVKKLQHKHTADIKHEAVEPTCGTAGTKEYYECATCHRRVDETGYLLYWVKRYPTGKHTASDWIIDKEPTAESEGLKHTECTVCKKVLEKEAIPKLDSVDPKPSNPEPSDPKPSNPEPGTTDPGKVEKRSTDTLALNNDINSLSSSLLTDQERELVKNGADAVVYAKLGTEVDKTNLEKVNAALGTLTLGKAYDISLWVQVGDNAARQITSTSEKINLSLKVDDSLINKNSNIKRTYKVIRIHDGVAAVLEGSFDEATQMFTFETDQFSTYALVYVDTAVSQEPSVTPPSATPEPAAPSPTPQPAAASPVQSVTSPKTGDTSPSLWMFAIIIIAGVGIAGYGLKRKTYK